MFERFEDCTSRFVSMRAVVETAVFAYTENFGEIVRYFVELHIDHTEAFDARGVDEVGLRVDGIHFAEGGGVHTFMVIVGNLGCAGVRIRDDLVDYSAFANARIAR